MLKEFSVRINIVKHDIGVAAVARGEENQLESVDQVVQQGKGVGSDVNTRFEDLASLHFDSEFDVVTTHTIIISPPRLMNQNDLD